MRKGTVIGGVMFVVLALALPVHAKGVGTATVHGPGLPKGGVKIPGHDKAILFEGGAFQEFKFPEVELSAKQLGPAYQLKMEFRAGPGNRGIIRQVVYPYAVDRPMLFTPEQRIGVDDIHITAGWTAAPSHFLTMLVRAGIPEPKSDVGRSGGHSETVGKAGGDKDGAAGAPGTAGHEASADTPGGIPAAVTWTIVAGSVLAGGLLVFTASRRLRRRPTVA